MHITGIRSYQVNFDDTRMPANTPSKRPRKYRRQAKPLLGFTSTIKWMPPGKDAPMKDGYAWVSMSKQNTQRQVDDLVKAEVAPVDIFGDTASGRDMERPGWKACVR